MKKILLTMLLLLTVFSSVFATSINSTPVATVRLYKNKVITQADLDNAMKAYQGTGATEADVLQLLINDEVFLQGAEHDGVTVNDTQLASLYAQQKSSYEEQTGVSLTTEQFDKIVEENYGSVDAF